MSNKTEPMYDYIRPPTMPKGTHQTVWHVVTKDSLRSQVHPNISRPNIGISYDKDRKVVGVRWVGENGEWKDIA